MGAFDTLRRIIAFSSFRTGVLNALDDHEVRIHGLEVKTDIAPIAAFTVSAVQRTVTCTNASTDADGTMTYLYDFGDGTFSTQTNPVKVYATDGLKTIVLTATDNIGVAVSTTRTIYVANIVTLGIDVFIGDSLYNGYGDAFAADNGLNLSVAYSNVKFMGMSATGTTDPMPWTYTETASTGSGATPTSLKPRGATGAPNMGPELAYGRLMDTYGGDAGTGAILTFTINGVALGGAQGFLPSASYPAVNLEAQLWARIDRMIAATGLPVRAFHVSLGANDTGSQATSDALPANYATFFGRLWTRYGTSIPVFLQKQHFATDITQAPFRDNVRAKQISYTAGESRCILVSYDRIPLNPSDNIHPDVNGSASQGAGLYRVTADYLRPSRNSNKYAGGFPAVQAIYEPFIYSVNAPKPRAPDAVVGELQIMFQESLVENAATILTTPQNFAAVAGTALTVNNVGSYLSTAMFSRAITQAMLDAGLDPVHALDPTLGDAASENFAGIISVRGPSPMTNANIEQIRVTSGIGLSVSVPSGTTAGPNRLLLTMVLGGWGGAVGLGTFSNWACAGADAASVVEQKDSQAVFTNKFNVGICSAKVSAAGAFGPFTCDITGSYSWWVAVTLIIKP